jgi:hypothetical protein
VAPPRSRRQRRRDTEHRLAHDNDEISGRDLMRNGQWLA